MEEKLIKNNLVQAKKPEKEATFKKREKKKETKKRKVLKLDLM